MKRRINGKSHFDNNVVIHLNNYPDTRYVVDTFDSEKEANLAYDKIVMSKKLSLIRTLKILTCNHGVTNRINLKNNQYRGYDVCSKCGYAVYYNNIPREIQEENTRWNERISSWVDIENMRSHVKESKEEYDLAVLDLASLESQYLEKYNVKPEVTIPVRRVNNGK